MMSEVDQDEKPEEEPKEQVDETSIVEEKGPTEYEICYVKYNRLVAVYHNAMRFVREAVSYKKTFEANESWGEGHEMYDWFRKDADQVMSEVWDDMKKMRMNMKKMRVELKQLRKKENIDD